MRDRIQGTVGMWRKPGAGYVASYGGGVNSAAMIILLVRNGLPPDCAVFSDTGDEVPETYAYLGVMREYLQKRGIPLRVVRVRDNTSLSDRCLKRRVIPSQVWRWCTGDMKVRPVHALYRKLRCHVYQYMGIDWGEVHRTRPAKVGYVTNLYPLIDRRLGREECVGLIRDARLPAPAKSGCYLCPFNSTARWAEIHAKHPDLYKRAMMLEENGKHFGRQGLVPGGHTLRELEGMMGNGQRLPTVLTDSPSGGECMA